jgi:hypothetical protein
MVAIVRIERKRKVEEGKDTAFSVRKRPVDPKKINRFIRDHDIPDTRSQMSRKFFKRAYGMFGS